MDTPETKTFTLFAKSDSSDDKYTVIVKFTDSKISCVCDCAAGAIYMNCKHKRELLEGNIKRLYDSDQVSELETVSKALHQTNYFNRLKETLAQIDGIDKEKKLLTKKVTEIKNQFAYSLSQGI
jgi:ribosomal protein L14E/L6E/L27E